MSGTTMSRIHDRLFRLTDEIDRLRAEERLTAGELGMLRHIDDDAQRDAAVGGPLERDDARMTAADVERFRKTLASMGAKRARLEAKRERLLKRLG
ncbi:MAG: hypothetical protein MUP76_00200 [Acidimicrobiia bacterium]|nr:hypothetical protein [Acidimicrobiia bacterium]